MSKVAVVAGSTGLIGHELLRLLCESPEYAVIKTIVRNPTGFKHSKVQEHVVVFDRVWDYAHLFAGDVFFCCLGSTMKKTPDKAVYYKIDHDYPVAMARMASDGGMSQFHLISSIGAKLKAASFYLKMKGETERDIAHLSFEAIHIYRPSVLAGKRKEHRWLEQLGLKLFRWINPLLQGRLKRYRSIEGSAVARAIYRQSLAGIRGVRIYESDEIRHIAGTD